MASEKKYKKEKEIAAEFDNHIKGKSKNKGINFIIKTHWR